MTETLVYKVEKGRRTHEKIVSSPLEKVSNEYIIKDGALIVDIVTGENMTTLFYKCGMKRVIKSNELENDNKNNNKFNKKGINKMIKNVKSKQDRLNNFLESMLSYHDELNILKRDDLINIFGSVSNEYETMEQLKVEFDFLQEDSILFDSHLETLINYLLEGLEKDEVIEHITSPYGGYIELFYLTSDDMYAMIL